MYKNKIIFNKYGFDLSNNLKYNKNMLKGLAKFKAQHNIKTELDFKKKINKGFFLNMKKVQIKIFLMIKNGLYNKYNI